MFRSIRWRIAIPYTILLVVTLSLLGIYLSNFLRETHLTDLRERLSAQVRLTSDTLASAIERGEQVDELDRRAREWAELFQARVTIIAPDGSILGDSHDDRLLMENHLNRPEVAQALEGERSSSIRFSRTLGYNMIYVAGPVVVNGNVAGVVRVGVPLQEMEANVAHLHRTLFGITLVATTMAIVLAVAIAAGATHHIRKLTDVARQLSEGELDLPPGVFNDQDEVGQLARVFTTMSTQLNTKIEALRTESSKLSAVLEQMTDGALIADEQGRVQLLNPAAERMFGIHGKEVRGRSLAQVLRHYKLIELWERSLETGENQEVTLQLSPSNISLQGVAIPLGQALQGSTLLLFQDLTRLHRLETIRRDFISNISHELRTPLASMKALTETLKEGALEDPPAATRFLDLMEAEVDALTQIVSELLELSRMESGRTLLHFQTTDPIKLLQGAYNRLSVQAARARLTLQVDCPDDLPKVLADPPRMEQVLVNLLHNAIKFTPPGGEINLSARQEGEGSAVSIVFEVRDSGVGIPQDDLPRIFERFYKADRARSGGGTGLGLAIARHFVEAHGGRIWAESREGQGSSFYFSLPVFEV